MTERKTRETYLTEDAKLPFCKGCGHTHSIRHLDKALTILQRDPASVNLVSDIGCIGLVDALFAEIHTVHTTHGRSTAFATGIELADSILYGSDLKTIVILGDGGATIGLLHLVSAALMNIDITVIVCNNLIYGMTGGQQSGFTPIGMTTATSPSGNIIPPIDICAVMKECEAGFVARELATNKNIPEMLAKAIDYTGFALVELMELCPEYALKTGNIDGKRLRALINQKEMNTGILVNREDRIEFPVLYKESLKAEKYVEYRKKSEETVEIEYPSSLQNAVGIVIAGTAGERVQSSAFMLVKAAVASGLHATQKNDNPVTQGSGFSISEVIISPNEIFYTGIEIPHLVIISSLDGLNELLSNGIIAACGDETLIIADSSIPKDQLLRGKPVIYPLREKFGADRGALGALGGYIFRTGILSRKTLEREIEKKFKDHAHEMLRDMMELSGLMF